MREDISWMPGLDTLRITCDLPGCRAEVKTRAKLGEWPEGWEQDSRQTELTTATLTDYCPEHAYIASRDYTVRLVGGPGDGRTYSAGPFVGPIVGLRNDPTWTYRCDLLPLREGGELVYEWEEPGRPSGTSA